MGAMAGHGWTDYRKLSLPDRIATANRTGDPRFLRPAQPLARPRSNHSLAPVLRGEGRLPLDSAPHPPPLSPEYRGEGRMSQDYFFSSGFFSSAIGRGKTSFFSATFHTLTPSLCDPLASSEPSGEKATLHTLLL